MQVVSQREGAVTILKPLGPLVVNELEELQGILDELASHWVRRLVLNLSHCTFIDSAGLETLMQYQHAFQEYGVKMKLCGMNELTRQIFDLTRLTSQFEIYPDSSTAVRSYL